MKRLIKVLLNLALIGVITFSMLEGILYLFLHNPQLSLLPTDVTRNIYTRELRNVIQADPECSQYDDYVSYTLRPGECRFKNIEFDTHYAINSQGLRDSESALSGPEIIVLGDSFTMGWGVEQDEAYPKLIESLTGTKTLNAGISSYATARELRLLERLDKSNLKYLIIQYSDNDVRENQYLYDNGGLDITTKEKWQEVSEDHLARRDYFPGRYSLIVLFHGWQWLAQSRQSVNNAADSISDAEEAKYFVNALKSSRVNLNDYKVILFEINGHNNNDNNFIDAVEKLIKTDGFVISDNFTFLHLEYKLSDDMYYIYDDHINNQGHRLISDEIVKLIN